MLQKSVSKGFPTTYIFIYKQFSMEWGFKKNSGGMNKASSTNLFCNPCSKEH